MVGPLGCLLSVFGKELPYRPCHITLISAYIVGIINSKLYAHVRLMDQILCRNQCHHHCRSADIIVADVLGTSVIYIGYYMLFDQTNWWLLKCG